MYCFILNNVIAYQREKSFCCRQKKKLSLISNHRNFEYIILLICSLNILNVHGSTESNVSYVDECRSDCDRLQDPLACGKFRVVRWIHNLTNTKDINYGSLRFVRLSSTEEESILPEIPMLRNFSGYSKFLNFVLSSARDMLTHRAFVYTVEQPVNARSLSSGPTILDTDEFDEIVELGRSAEDRGLHRKKRKLSIILPLLILIKVIKIKLMMIPVLIGIHFIKKILLIGGLAVASIISNLKYCKVTPPNHHHPVSYSTWATAADTPVDFPTAPSGHGHEDDGWSQKIDTAGYDALLVNAQRNAYRAYYQTLKQQQLHNAI